MAKMVKVQFPVTEEAAAALRADPARAEHVGRILSEILTPAAYLLWRSTDPVTPG